MQFGGVSEFCELPGFKKCELCGELFSSRWNSDYSRTITSAVNSTQGDPYTSLGFFSIIFYFIFLFYFFNHPVKEHCYHSIFFLLGRRRPLLAPSVISPWEYGGMRSGKQFITCLKLRSLF